MKNLPAPPSQKPVKRRHPNAVEAGRPHQWGSARRGPGSQPAWVDDLSGGNRKVCRVCGVTEVKGGVNADHAGFDPLDKERLMKGRTAVSIYTYWDAKNNRFESQVPLGCPTFMLDHKGLTMENKERVRRVDDRVDGVEDRIDLLESRVDEAQADIKAVVDWLREMVELHAAQGQDTVQVSIEGQDTVALPAPVAQMIIDIGQVREKVSVHEKGEEDALEAEFEVVLEREKPTK